MTSRTRIAIAAMGATAATLAAGPAVIASTYVVRPGDSLSDIAIRHGCTVSALVAANHIVTPDVVRVGQLLRIPDSSLGLPTYTKDANDVETYAVQPGEDLFQIARSFGVDPTALARANGIGVSTTLHNDTALHIPGRLARSNALLTHIAHEVAVDPPIVRAIAWMESGWQQSVVSSTGAVGMMQVEPYTCEWVSKYLAGRTLNLHMAADNVRAGSLLIKHLLTVHDGDVNATLAAYYQGDASISKHGVYGDTERYQRVVSTLIAKSV